MKGNEATQSSVCSARARFQVTVIIPVYNAEGYVAEAIESALAKADTGEVILIADGSPDVSLPL